MTECRGLIENIRGGAIFKKCNRVASNVIFGEDEFDAALRPLSFFEQS
jgi:hypothetical protein